jgi:hypothetical protein
MKEDLSMRKHQTGKWRFIVINRDSKAMVQATVSLSIMAVRGR